MSDATNTAAPAATPASAPATAPAATAPVAAPSAPAANPYAAKPAEAPQAAPTPTPAPATQTEQKPAAKDQNYWAKNASLTSVAKMGAQAQAAQERATALEAQNAQLTAALKSQAEQLIKDLPTEAMRTEIASASGGDPFKVIEHVNLLKRVGAINAPVPAAPSTSVAPTSTPSPASAEDPDISLAREVQRLEGIKAFQSAGLMKNANRPRYEAGLKKLSALNTAKN